MKFWPRENESKFLTLLEFSRILSGPFSFSFLTDSAIFLTGAFCCRDTGHRTAVQRAGGGRSTSGPAPQGDV